MRLEQRDSYLTTFNSRVTDVVERGGNYWLALAESAFYPTSGGQPCDGGTLNGHPVVDVMLRDGRVWHRLGDGPLKVGATVEGHLDWSRRFRHMQRHSAQHLLSQAFLRIDPSFETRSVSLSAPDCSCDLAGHPSAEDIDAAELLVNQTAYCNLSIRAFEITEDQVGQFPLRRPPKVTGRIRLVAMGDFELSACGGTHLRSTAEAAPIKLLRSERIKGDLTRVVFRAGLEAVDDYRLKHRVGSALALSFSTQLTDLPERIDSLRKELTDHRRSLTALRKQLAAARSRELPVRPGPTGERIVVHVLPEAEAELLSPLATALTANERTVALLAAPDSDRVRLLFTRGEAVDLDMNALLRTALPYVNGRGGGRADSAQGAGTRRETAEAALEAAAKEIDADRTAPRGL